MTENAQMLATEAMRHHQAGDVAAAVPLYRAAIDLQPENYDALYLLGTAQLQLGRFSESIETFRQVVAARPNIPDVHNNLGVAFQALGKWADAARSYQQAIKIHPDYENAFFNLGALMEGRGIFADAEKCYRHVLKLNPYDVKSRVGLANSLRSLQRWREAEAEYRTAAECSDAPAPSAKYDIEIQIAFVLAKQERLDEAAEIYLHLLKEDPDHRETHQIHNSLSYIRERQGRLDEAVECARRAIDRVPRFAEGYNNLGNALRSQHRLDEACAAFRQALEIRPDFPLAQFNLGTTHLLAGDYLGGWPGYEKHSALNESPSREFAQPQWHGESIRGKRLLVYADQGFGDAIQFARFLPKVREEFACTVIFECPPELKPLFDGQLQVDEFVAEGSPLPDFDVQLPLASLPGRLEVDLQSVGAGDAYLGAKTALRPELAHLLHGANPQLVKIGVVWKGNPKQARNVVRSCPFHVLMPLLAIEGTQWFSLQTDEDRYEQMVKLAPAHRPVDVGAELRDFADTAAVMSRLDLILTVDTATAHLAGALGRPVWTMLCHTPDWRWHLERADSPWYPTMRLFRQPHWGDWDAVVQQIDDELHQLTSKRHKPGERPV